MIFIRTVVFLTARAVFLQLGRSTMASDKDDKFRKTNAPVDAQEQDILETVAKHPLGVQVKAKDGSAQPKTDSQLITQLLWRFFQSRIHANKNSRVLAFLDLRIQQRPEGCLGHSHSVSCYRCTWFGRDGS